MGVGWFHIALLVLWFVTRKTVVSYKSAGSRLASFPGHSQILSRTRFFFPWLQDKIWEWSGNEAIALDQRQDICIYSKWVGIPVRVLAITCSRKGGMSSRVGFVFKSR